MRPLFHRAGLILGLRFHRSQTTENEEIKNYLKLSDKMPGLTASPGIVATRSRVVNARRESDMRIRPESRQDLPYNRIMVDLDLEQNVHDLRQ